MIEPGPSDHEELRLLALQKLHVLDTPFEERFDRILRVVKEFFNVPFASITFIDEDRQWSKGCLGLPVKDIDRKYSFCAHTILQDDVFVVENATKDKRFFDNPYVLGKPYIRFYAGSPIKTSNGYNIGALNIADTESRNFDLKKQHFLNDISCWVEAELYKYLK